MSKTRICIITARNIYDSPCLEKYEHLIKEPCDIIFWDRHGIEEHSFASNQYKYVGRMNVNSGKLKKLVLYIKFAKFVRKILFNNHYECLIIFPSHTAWLIYDILTKKYKGKYILDIRDYSGENNPIIYYITKKLINNSGVCSITSMAYEKFLPKHNYVISHNIQKINKELIKQYRESCKEHKKRIVISFIGTVRFIEQQKKLIKRFSNDERFLLQFIGRGSEQLEDFCKKVGANNIVLMGRFERKELANLYLKTDIVMNVYGNNNPFLDYALSNKLYSAALMGMPIMCSPNTYMAEISSKYGFGFPVDVDNDLCADKVFEVYSSKTKKEIFKACDSFMEKVYADEKYYSTTIKKFISGIQ